MSMARVWYVDPIASMPPPAIFILMEVGVSAGSRPVCERKRANKIVEHPKRFTNSSHEISIAISPL